MLHRTSQKGSQTGVALLIVLWVLVLLTIVSSTLALLARSENLEARTLFDGSHARMGALAGFQRAVYEMRNPDLETKWIPDGRTYQFPLDDITVTVSLTDETGKLDMNSATPELMIRLFMGHGLDQAQAEQLADAIQDWRDPDDAVRPLGAEADAYESAGFSWVPPNGPFGTVEELQQVIGMTYELYERIEPGITVFSGRGNINAAFAPREALLALPEVDAFTADDIISQRQQQSGLDRQPILLPDGTSVIAQGGGLTYSVKARGTLNNRAYYQVEGTFRLGTDLLGRPFRVVRWREGVSG